jgi:hypothetical protein
VNFTGTAGVWCADALHRIGGWKSTSLVEDCEISFRALFDGYETAFVKEIVSPAELPASLHAYRAQQRRWTVGWAQLQRLHAKHLVSDYSCPPMRRLHLSYHMFTSCQWPLWVLWTMLLPALMYSGAWLGDSGVATGAAVYLGPAALWLLVSTVLASWETPDGAHRHPSMRTLLSRLSRSIPYVCVSSSMLGHQFASYCEGMFGPLSTEFERTPKAATILTDDAPPDAMTSSSDRPAPLTIRGPYLASEIIVTVTHLLWSFAFFRAGMTVATASSFVLALLSGIGVATYGHSLRVLVRRVTPSRRKG